MFPFMLILAIAIGILIWACMQSRSTTSPSSPTSRIAATWVPTCLYRRRQVTRADSRRTRGGRHLRLHHAAGHHRVPGVGLRAAVRPDRRLGRHRQVRAQKTPSAAARAVSPSAGSPRGGRHPVRHRVDDRQRGVEDQEDWIAEARQEDAWVKYAQQDDPCPGDPKTPRRPKRRPRRPPRAKPTTPRDARGSTRKVPFGHQRVLFVPSTFPLSRPTISTRRENRMPARGGRRRGTHERFALRRSDRSDHETRCRKQRVLVSQERRRSTHVFAGSRVSRRCGGLMGFGLTGCTPANTGGAAAQGGKQALILPM